MVVVVLGVITTMVVIYLRRYVFLYFVFEE